MSMGIWMYFWDDADWVLPEATPATRYIYRHRLNYVIRAAILWASLLWAVLWISPRGTTE